MKNDGTIRIVGRIDGHADAGRTGTDSDAVVSRRARDSSAPHGSSWPSLATPGPASMPSRSMGRGPPSRACSTRPWMGHCTSTPKPSMNACMAWTISPGRWRARPRQSVFGSRRIGPVVSAVADEQQPLGQRRPVVEQVGLVPDHGECAGEALPLVTVQLECLRREEWAWLIVLATREVHNGLYPHTPYGASALFPSWGRAWAPPCHRAGDGNPRQLVPQGRGSAQDVVEPEGRADAEKLDERLWKLASCSPVWLVSSALRRSSRSCQNAAQVRRSARRTATGMDEIGGLEGQLQLAKTRF